jgi:hypothetical protein
MDLRPSGLMIARLAQVVASCRVIHEGYSWCGCRLWWLYGSSSIGADDGAVAAGERLMDSHPRGLTMARGSWGAGVVGCRRWRLHGESSMRDVDGASYAGGGPMDSHQ